MEAADICVFPPEVFGHEQPKKHAYRDTLGTDLGKESSDVLTSIILYTVLGELGRTPKAPRREDSPSQHTFMPNSLTLSFRESSCTGLPA